MAESIDPIREKRGDDPETTGIVQRARPYDFRDRDSFDLILPEEALPPELQTPGYVREPIFNKKVMLAWAAAAFGVWIAVTYIVPIVVESARSAVMESVQSASRSGKRPGKVTITRNGRTITITTGEPAHPAAPPTTPAPVVAPAPVAPTEPVAPPAPVHSGTRTRRR